MFMLSNCRTKSLSLVSLLLVIVTTAVHHIFRLGPELVPVSIVMLGVPVVILALYEKTKHHALLIAYGIYSALVIFLFGIIDGFIDHVLKALGLQNTTFLPGSEAEIVATVYSLWSPGATYTFYEGSGVLTFLLSIAATIYTAMFLNEGLRSPRPQGLLKPTA